MTPMYRLQRVNMTNWQGAGEINPMMATAYKEWPNGRPWSVTLLKPLGALIYQSKEIPFMPMKNTNSYHFNQRAIGLAFLGLINNHNGYEYL